MRLFLSSYKFGNHPEKLLHLLGTEKPRIAIISNASDLHTEEEIIEKLNVDIEFFKKNGLLAERLDLRDYFGDHEKLEEKFKDYGMVWVTGGNTFVLRRAAEYSGFDNIIKKRIENNSIVYAGYSAGACLISATLHGIELCDDAYSVPDLYNEEVIWDGLGIVPYAIAPHYDSDHPESSYVDEVINYFYENDIPHKKLRDGEVIIINGDQENLI